MADEEMSQFTPNTSPADGDYVTGYLGSAPGVAGSNQRWSFLTIKDYVLNDLSISFTDITDGTNTAALLIGTGGSLGVSGSGTIAATTSTVLATSRSIYGNNFNGSADLAEVISGIYGGTGVNNGANTITATANATVNQDTRTTATPSFASANLTGATLTQSAVTANTSTAYTIDPANGAEFNLTMNSATPAITLQTPIANVTKLATLILTQDATGGRVPSWSGVTWVSGTPAINSAPNAATFFSFLYNGTTCYGFASPLSTGTGNVVLAGSPAFSASFTTTPPSSNTATTAFGSSLTLGTALQNTTGYDLLVNIVISVTAATAATIVMGIGSTSTPTTNTAISTFSITGDFTLTAYVPNGYYLLVDKTGTLTSTNNIIAMGI